MLQVRPVSFTSNTQPRKSAEEKREDIRDTAMAGGAAGAGYSAARSGGLNMAKKLKEGSSAVNHATGTVKNGVKTAKDVTAAFAEPVEKATGLFKNFKGNATRISNNIMNNLKDLKVGKFVQRFIETPVVKTGCRVCGGFLAGCILLSGLGSLYSNTTKIVDHYAPKLADNFNELAEKCKTSNEE